MSVKEVFLEWNSVLTNPVGKGATNLYDVISTRPAINL